MRRKIESLHGLIDVERHEDPPTMAFFLIRKGVETDPDGVANMTVTAEGFVREAVLPPELRKQIREAIRALPIPKMGPETQAEYDAKHADLVADTLRRNPLPPCPTCGESMRVKAETEPWRFLVECTNCGHLSEAEYDPQYELVPIGGKPCS